MMWVTSSPELRRAQIPEPHCIPACSNQMSITLWCPWQNLVERATSLSACSTKLASRATIVKKKTSHFLGPLILQSAQDLLAESIT